ncbi:MAG: hypothetical protein GX660_21020 [Clostridiaceae bacterium]|nr:hypothetical protein [Clostridiaceae bacterium]
MKYGLLTNPLHNWAVLRIGKTNKRRNNAEGTVLCSSTILWTKGEYSDNWKLDQIKIIPKEEALKIINTNHYQFPKLTVDFDGTLFSTHPDFPKIGKQKLIHKLVACYIRYKHKRGWIIILNTMRENGKGLEEAIQACEDYNIPIDLYNENFMPDIIRWGESRKIGAQLSIDDTQVGFIGWLLRRFG